MLDELKKRVLVSDGSTGVELQRRGLEAGHPPEKWNISHPGVIKNLYLDYFKAGADMVTTNTFGANYLRLKNYGLESKVYYINKLSAELANEVKPEGKFVNGDVGPIGEALEPYGTVTLKEAEDYFREQIKGLRDGGVDAIIIETMMAVEEVEIAIKVAKEETKLPIIATMTFEFGKAGFRTPWGVDTETAVVRMISAGADVIGANCGRGFDEMIGIIEKMSVYIEKNFEIRYPLIAQPNAGIPDLVDGTPVYKETPELIIPKVRKLLELGVRIIGGCCGTGPEHIKVIRKLVDEFNK
jgi:5-methyltetrahydrofolate--homocysteine methyltransferase